MHWLGKRQIELLMGSYYFMRVWQLPETAKLEARILTQLSSAPSRWLKTPAERSRLAVPLFDTSLKDMVLDECHLEIRQPANQAAEFAFAIHLDSLRTSYWETNTANIIGLLTGAWPIPFHDGHRGWSLHRSEPPNLLKFLHVGDWAVIGIGPDTNALFNEICDRIQHYDDPFAVHSSTNWLEVNANLNRLPGSLKKAWNLPESLPRISFAIAGDGANVLTRGKMIFPQPLHVEFEPWAFPTNLIHEPLDSFTAVRSLKPWLTTLKRWRDLPLSESPDQLYFWSLPGAAAQVYFATPMSDASNQVCNLTEYLMAKGNPWLASNGYVRFECLPESNGVRWGNMPSIQPFFQFVNAADGGLVFGGLLQDTVPGNNSQSNLYDRPALSQLLHQMSMQTNLVYYDWEYTRLRIQPCLYLGQVLRVVSRHAQLPLESTDLKWLEVVEPRLGNCTTEITVPTANQLVFARKSTVGFTGAELQLLADWLESPQFPRGLYSLSVSPNTTGQ